MLNMLLYSIHVKIKASIFLQHVSQEAALTFEIHKKHPVIRLAVGFDGRLFAADSPMSNPLLNS